MDSTAVIEGVLLAMIVVVAIHAWAPRGGGNQHERRAGPERVHCGRGQAAMDELIHGWGPAHAIVVCGGLIAAVVELHRLGVRGDSHTHDGHHAGDEDDGCGDGD